MQPIVFTHHNFQSIYTYIMLYNIKLNYKYLITLYNCVGKIIFILTVIINTLI